MYSAFSEISYPFFWVWIWALSSGSINAAMTSWRLRILSKTIICCQCKCYQKGSCVLVWVQENITSVFSIHSV